MIYIDEETGRMVNIYAPFKGRSRLDSAEIRAAVGVIEITDDVAPDDYSEDLYFRTEDWFATQRPYIIYSRKPDEMVAKTLQERTNAQSRAYLADTDWYVSRFSETGTPIPDDIKAARQAARGSVIHLEVGNEITA